MQDECFKRSQQWAQVVQAHLDKSLYKHVKFDVMIAAALVSAKQQIEDISPFVRDTDEVVRLDSKHFLIFYYYTSIQESRYAIQNLYKRLQNDGYESKIVCTDIKATDRYPLKLLQRLCAMSCHLDHKGKDYLASSKTDEVMEIFDVDLSDL